MPSIQVELTHIIKDCDEVSFFLPDSVDTFGNNNIVVADSGNDRICLLNSEGDTIKSIGGKGFGRYRFKEPVGVFVSPEQKAYVADWHNHRVVVYDESLNYVTEFGHYGRLDEAKSIIEKVLRFIRFASILAYKGSYQKCHFSVASENEARSKRYSLRLFLSSLSYWCHRNTSLASSVRMIISTYDAIDKPNGVAFYRDRILVSQKNSRCLTFYKNDQDTETIKPQTNYFGPSDDLRFGRLGNVACDSKGFVYVCDERNHIIWKLDTNLKLTCTITGQDSGVGDFLPFSCCFISDDIMAVCGGLNFQMIDLNTNQAVYYSEVIGELHGIAYNKKLKRLYLTDRSHSVVKVYNVKVT